MCDEMERSIHDALCVVKRVMESKSIVPGGGCVEAALSIYLENFATSLVSSSGENIFKEMFSNSKPLDRKLDPLSNFFLLLLK